MDSTQTVVDFTLQPAGMAPVRVLLRRAGTRWIARVDDGVVTVGGSARVALIAALEPLGQRRVTVLLADLGLLEPSLAVMEIESAHASA